MGEEESEEAVRKISTALSSKDDGKEQKKTQFQRLWEFELWRDDKALKDLEYSQRRTEKQQRRRERKKDRRYRRWKMLYLPAMLGMVGGTVLTLTATLQGLGRGSFLWDARDVVIIVGPVIIASGFICLMLAAGCTFQHEQETRQASKPPEEFIGLLGFVPDKFISRRRSTAVRSISLDTYDMPVPADLDPNRNYILGKARHHPGPRRHLASQSDSTCSDVFLMSQNSYSSTASWVKSLTVTHQQQRGQLTRQQSDSNILTACQQDRSVSATARRCLDDSTGRADAFGSHSDLHVVCTSSLASSGYHSSASDTTSVFLDARATCSRSGSKHVQSTCCSVSSYGCGTQIRNAVTHMKPVPARRMGSIARYSGNTSLCDKSPVAQQQDHDQIRKGRIRPLSGRKCVASGRTFEVRPDVHSSVGDHRPAAGHGIEDPISAGVSDVDSICAQRQHNRGVAFLSAPCAPHPDRRLYPSGRDEHANTAVTRGIPLIVIEPVVSISSFTDVVRCTEV